VERFGQIVCNRHEELSISLKEVRQRWHVEFCVHGPAQEGLTESRPGRSVINLPIEQLPQFLDRLEQVRDSCVKRGQLDEGSVGEMVVMDQGERVVLRDSDRLRGHRARQHRRFPVRYPVVCQPLPTDRSPRPTILRAEFRDLSVGGAQILLPCRLELGQQVEVAGLIEGQPFRARAEVVGAELQAGGDAIGGDLRHSLKWLTYNAAAADILTMALFRSSGDRPARPDAACEPGTFPEQVPAETAWVGWPKPDDTPGAAGPLGYSREIGKPLGYATPSPGTRPRML
jgi:PilZ domain